MSCLRSRRIRSSGEQHPERDRYKEDVFRVFFKEALESGGAFVIIDRKVQQIIGSTRFYGYDPVKSRSPDLNS